MSACDLPACLRPHYGRGYCRMHYQRWRRTGDPMVVRVGPKPQPAAPRLAERSERRGACLIYTRGKPSRSGHRLIGYDGGRVGVHRVAWMLAHGPIPDGLCVLHRCDEPSCIEPTHLFLGTPADNNRDRDQKGRHRSLRGSRQNRAKLGEWQIPTIRTALAAGRPQRAIAAEYGVSQATIQLIGAGRTWTHVPALAEAS